VRIWQGVGEVNLTLQKKRVPKNWVI
jgi:hypothetical protein